MSIKNLIISTHNYGKLNEYKSFFKNLPFNITSAADHNLPEPEETGEDFEDNAILKARASAKITNIMSLGEDSGLIIDSLNGFPGIKTGRWAKEQGGYEQAFKNLEGMLIGKDHSAYFYCAIAIYNPENNHIEIFSGTMNGVLRFPASGSNGFGYDPIFVPDSFDQTLAELNPEIKMQISHRSKCLEQVKNYFHNFR